MTRARFDKLGRRLPDRSRGCGCGLREEEKAPSYECREEPEERRLQGAWSPARRVVSRLMRSLVGLPSGIPAHPAD